MEVRDVLAVLCAVGLGTLTLWLLHKIKNKDFAKHILTPLVVDIVTAGVLLYVLCVWVIGSLSVAAHQYFIFIDGRILIFITGAVLLLCGAMSLLNRPFMGIRSKILLSVAMVPATFAWLWVVTRL